MKKLYFVILLLCSTTLFSQYTSSGIGRWRLGLNVGATWQTANINSSLFDLGYGATLEYAAYEKYNSFFGFSFRGRFLGGQTKGYNELREYGPIDNNNINGVNDSTFNYSKIPAHLNNRTKYKEFSLEAMLKWNRLYQNHGIIFYLYLGGGFTSYKVETNQKDVFGLSYDYSTINEGSSNTLGDLKSLLDDSYETELSHPDYNSLVFTPSVGIGFGFRITRGFDIVWEHKTSLPQTDLFEGQSRNLDDPSFVKDIYHYSSLGLIFSIVGHTEPTTYEPPVEPSEPIIPITPITSTPLKPTIILTKPITTGYNTPNCKVEIIATINHVKEQKDIEFYHNGNKVPSYNYFFSAPTFKSNIQLIDGNNNFKIIAKNGNLSESKEFSLQCNNINTIIICHKDANGYSTISINESEWATHAAHGDTKGACPEAQINICHNIPGQPGKTQSITIPESQWAIHKSHGDILGNCQEKKMINICHQGQTISIEEKDWATHAAHGDIKGDCPQVKMITICHIPEQGDKRISMTIPENEWIVHQAHGDIVGSCPNIEPTITICHKNSNNTKSTITIPEFRWNEHFSHGDSKSPCPESSFIICHTDPITKKKENISIYESSWAIHAGHGDTKGACPVIDKQITICHNIPGQPGKTQTISIPESQWLLHKSHGDNLGVCPKVEKQISICHNSNGVKTNITIPESQWAVHAAHGDIKGKCPVIDKQITICHNIPGQPGKTQAISIPESQWLLHKSHGDNLGVCPEVEKQISICHNSNGVKTNISIPESQWANHAAHGDTKGNCIVTPNLITICHNIGDTSVISSGGKDNPSQTIQILETDWPKHAAHGDIKGECNITTGSSGGGGLGSGGSNTGSGKNNIKICHYPDGPNSIPTTIEIDSSNWESHRSHGDNIGGCPNTKNIETAPLNHQEKLDNGGK